MKRRKKQGRGSEQQNDFNKAQEQEIEKEPFFFLISNWELRSSSKLTCLKAHLQLESSSSFPVIYRGSHFLKPALFLKAVTIYTELWGLLHAFSAPHRSLSQREFALHAVEKRRMMGKGHRRNGVHFKTFLKSNDDYPNTSLILTSKFLLLSF